MPAQGIANAMQIIRGQLSPMYIQHEAIEAQKLMVNSPNHTVVYIPSGPMGVPVTGTFSATEPRGPVSMPVRQQWMWTAGPRVPPPHFTAETGNRM